MPIMFGSDYSLAWTAYLIGAFGGFWVGCRMTRWLWPRLRLVLRVLLGVVLFTPTLVDPGRDLYAPASAITAMDVLFHLGNNAWRAVSDLVLYGLFGLGGCLLWFGMTWWWRHQYPPVLTETPSAVKEPPTYAQNAQDLRSYSALKMEPRL